MPLLTELMRRAGDLLRQAVAVLGLAVVAAGLVDRFLVHLPVAMPEGQALFWYAAAAGAACFGCRS